MELTKLTSTSPKNDATAAATDNRISLSLSTSIVYSPVKGRLLINASKLSSNEEKLAESKFSTIPEICETVIFNIKNTGIKIAKQPIACDPSSNCGLKSSYRPV